MLFVISATGDVLSRVDFGMRGARFGASLARAGERLYVGAPNADTGGGLRAGAVVVVNVRNTLAPMDVWAGGASGDAFGSAVVRVGIRGADATNLLIGAPGASACSSMPVACSRST